MKLRLNPHTQEFKMPLSDEVWNLIRHLFKKNMGRQLNIHLGKFLRR